MSRASRAVITCKHLTISVDYRVRYFWGRYFRGRGSEKIVLFSLLPSDWFKFGTLPQKTYLYNCPAVRN